MVTVPLAESTMSTTTTATDNCIPYAVEIVDALRLWLGEDGISFFSEIKERFGAMNVVGALDPDGRVIPAKQAREAWSKTSPSVRSLLPHPIHLREGMQVRNFLRTLSMCEGWTAHDFDDRWSGLVEMAIDGGSGGSSLGGHPPE